MPNEKKETAVEKVDKKKQLTEILAGNAMLTQLRAARRVSVPMVAIVSPDPQATMTTVHMYFEEEMPLLRWDFCRGLDGINVAGKKVVKTILEKKELEQSVTINPTDCLTLILDSALGSSPALPEGTMLFMINAQLVLGPANQSVTQAICNLRDLFKATKRMVVMIGVYMEQPPEIAQDVLTIEEPLPSPDEIRRITVALMENTAATNANWTAPSPEIIEKAIDAMRGLGAFTCDQVLALSVIKSGLDLDKLWNRKRQMIESTPGLSVWRGGERFDDVGGLSNIKKFLMKVLKGKAAPRSIIFCDEIEKMMAGSIAGVGDSSGVSQAMLGIMLSYMQDNSATGMILVGPPGGGKSMIAKAAGSEIGIPTIQFDLSGMKGSFVGDSERTLRQALRVVSAVSDNAPLFIATCNSIAVLPPELRRRFSLGIFFLDLADADERKVVWEMYMPKFGLGHQEMPKDEGWTPAEIRMCCDIAWRMDCTLMEASQFVVPVAVSAKEQITYLRRMASNRFISASYDGLYQYKGSDANDELPVEPSRSMGGATSVN